MLYEFALDPEVLSTWHTFRYFIDRFGVHQGRMISRFPKKWKRMVYDATLGCGPVERKRIEEVLAAKINAKLLDTDRPYDGERSWLTNAEAQHLAHPFRAIITNANPRAIAEILLADDCDETRGATPLWSVSKTQRVPRKAPAIAAMATALLARSSQLVLVDPYFNPTKIEFRKPLEEFVRVLVAKGLPHRLEYHLRADHANAFGTNYFHDMCRRNLPPVLPAGIELKLVRWNQRFGGREFHARYLLTELGAIRFDPGLDEGDDGELTTMDLVEPNICTDLLSDFPLGPYPHAASTYEFSDEITVIGTA